jgi:hypothetical protein
VLTGSAGIRIDDIGMDGSGTGVTGCVIDVHQLYSTQTDYGGLANFGTYNTIRLTDPTIRAWDATATPHGTYAIQGRGGTSGNVLRVSNPVYLLPPASGNTLDSGQVVAPAGNAVLPGLQVGDTAGTGLTGVGGQLSVSVAGQDVMRWTNASPNANNGDVLVSGDTGAVYLAAEGLGANYNVVLGAKGSGSVVVPGGSLSAPGLQVGAVPTGLKSDVGDLGLIVGGNQALRIGTFDPTANLSFGGTATTLNVSAEGTAPNLGIQLTPKGSGVINLNGPVQITGTPIASIFAPMASPTFTGTPAAPTAPQGTATTQVATTAFVLNAVQPSGVLVSSAAAYTMQKSDAVVVIRKVVGSATAITLPVTPVSWAPYVIKDGGGDAATNNIVVSGSLPIDGKAEFVIDQPYESVTLVFNGVDWSVI